MARDLIVFDKTGTSWRWCSGGLRKEEAQLLPVTVPASRGDAAHPESSGRVSPEAFALDEHLFNPDTTQWLAIDAGNQAVPKTTITSLADGLALIGRGRIAALVGHLREGAGVVDIDVPGDFGNLLAAEVADWLCRRDCWVLHRPSGGAMGRAHVFFARPDFRYAAASTRSGFAAEIGDFLAGLAEEVRVPRHELDLRDAVRPLSSPHRRGLSTTPQGNLREALRDLKRVLPSKPPAAPLRPRARVQPTLRARPEGQSRPSATGAPLVFQRWQRQLREEWRRYLLTGGVPIGSWAAGPTRSRQSVAIDRSLVEAACTRDLVWAVGDPDIAWRIILESHPTAMTKAKHQGRTWWLTYIWNPLVRTAEELKLSTAGGNPAPPDPTPPEVHAAVQSARQALTRLMWTVPTRQRAALLLVGHHLLDRALRDRSLRIPCPERDLQLDCGLGDRKTIRAALARLNGRIGTVHTDCLSHLLKDSTSYEFEIHGAQTVGGRQIPPPVFDPPPSPPPPRGIWRVLPRPSHALWRILLTQQAPQPLDDLTVAAGLVDEVTDVPSKSQKATSRAALVALAQAGLAKADEYGNWVVATRAAAPHVEKEAADAHAEQLQLVVSERAAYRNGGTSTSWTFGRTQALKGARAREKAWWHSLSPAAREQRSHRLREQFEQMSLTQQAALKTRLADRRCVAGSNETDAHQDWLTSLPADELAHRSFERARRFQQLSPAERATAVAMWNRHRHRYGLNTNPPASPVITRAGQQRHGPHSDERELLPDGVAERDQLFLETQGTLMTLVPRRRHSAG